MCNYWLVAHQTRNLIFVDNNSMAQVLWNALASLRACAMTRSSNSNAQLGLSSHKMLSLNATSNSCAHVLYMRIFNFVLFK